MEATRRCLGRPTERTCYEDSLESSYVRRGGLSKPFLDVERSINFDEGQTPENPKEGKGEPS